MSKQDAVAARTAEDLERKYNYGRTFAELYGLSLDAQNAAASAEESANRAEEAVEAIDHEAVFNLLTKDGELQGFYEKDGKLYINAEFVQIVNLIADHLKSVSGENVLEADGAELKLYNGENLRFWLINDLYGGPIVGLFSENSSSSLGSSTLKLGYDNDNSVGGIELDGSVGQARLRINREATAKMLSWKDNGDGTFTLIGR
jgi:hypothetical protein